jgi:hypothetical protein
VNEVKGRYPKFSMLKGSFSYEYQCSRCGNLYRSTADSEDPLCGPCYRGGRTGIAHTHRGDGRKKRPVKEDDK